jgi:hypothetical protein
MAAPAIENSAPASWRATSRSDQRRAGQDRDGRQRQGEQRAGRGGALQSDIDKRLKRGDAGCAQTGDETPLTAQDGRRRHRIAPDERGEERRGLAHGCEGNPRPVRCLAEPDLLSACGHNVMGLQVPHKSGLQARCGAGRLNRLGEFDQMLQV